MGLWTQANRANLASVRTVETGIGDVQAFPDCPASLVLQVRTVSMVTVTHRPATSRQGPLSSLWMWKDPQGTDSHRQRARDWTGRDQLLRACHILLRVFTACLPGSRSSINLQPFVPATSPSEGGRPRVIKKHTKKEAFHERCKNLIWCIFVPESSFQKIRLPFLGDNMKWPEILFIPLSLYLCLQFSFLTFSPPPHLLWF